MECGPRRGVVCMMWSKAGPEPPWGGTGVGAGPARVEWAARCGARAVWAAVARARAARD